MVIVVRTDLKMGRGKAAAQVSRHLPVNSLQKLKSFSTIRSLFIQVYFVISISLVGNSLLILSAHWGPEIQCVKYPNP